MSTPKVSIVTPSYNQGEYISDTLDSVKNQTYSHIEHIVIDGNSTDGTIEILEEYKHDYNLSYISEDDEGQADAINKGFEMASGEIIGWLNSDDVYVDTRVIERVVNYFEEFDCDILYGDICQIDSHSNVIRVKPSQEFNIEHLRMQCYIPQPSTFLLYNIVSQEKLKDLAYTLDYEYWLRLSNRYSFKYIPDIFAGFRRYKEQKSQSKERIEERSMMFDELEIDHRKSNFDLVKYGVKWRLRSIISTINLYRSPPQLAFDGKFPPFYQAIVNLLIRD